MAKYAKELATKPDDRSSNSRTHMVEGENKLPVVLQPFLASCGMQMSLFSTE